MNSIGTISIKSKQIWLARFVSRMLIFVASLLPTFFFVADYSGDLSMSWNNTPAFPLNPEGFAWPQASSETFLPSPTQSSSLIFPLVTQPSFISTATGFRSFSVVSFPMTNELLTGAASHSSEFSRHNMLESHGVMYTSSAVDESHSVPHAALTSSQYTTCVNHNPTAAALPTGKNTLAN